MNDREGVEFLQWALPRLGMRWPGFRRVRGQVLKRVGRRLKTLGLDGPAAYRAHIEAHADEWAVLEECCRITISRFYRGRALFDHLAERLLPELATRRRGAELRLWSVGCAGGEELYTIALLWHLRLAARFGDVTLWALGTDIDAVQLARARQGCYPAGALKDLPEDLRRPGFEPDGHRLCLRARFRQHVLLRQQDLRRDLPDGPFDLVLCRYLAFTYFDADWQRRLAGELRARLEPGGYLVLGQHEHLFSDVVGFAEAVARLRIYRAV